MDQTNPTNTPEAVEAVEATVEAAAMASDELGDAGKKALTAERQRAKAAEAATKELQAQMAAQDAKFAALAEALTGKKSTEAPTAETALAQLEALRSELAKRDDAASERVKRSSVRALASEAGFHDPADAFAHLDLAKVELVDGDVDAAAVKAELAKLAEAKPYLVKAHRNVTPPQKLGVGAKSAGNDSLSGTALLAAALKK